jgi:hypothetical protein
MCSFLSVYARVPAGGGQNWWSGDDPASFPAITTPGFEWIPDNFFLFPGYSEAIVLPETNVPSLKGFDL